MESTTAIEEIKLHNGGEEILRLPEEIIIEEILPRLPVKSLLRFRCVAKSWCSFISSKKFIKLHLRNSIKSSSLAHHRIVFNTYDAFKHCSLPLLFTDAIIFNADFWINYQRGQVHLVGCCNGLVCILVNRRSFVLWNPTTKKSNHLPDFDNDIMMDGSIRKYGFGFDELNDDYKVFGVLSVFYKNGVSLCICKVYSLMSDSWEIIEEGGAYPCEREGTYVSGKLHWDTNERGIIVSFDLNSKVYGVVELPSYLENGMLGVLRGCLSVHCFQEGHVDFWVMKEYGLKESWDKVATVPYYRSHLCSLSTPFTIGPNGEVLLVYDDFKSNLLIYNPKGNVFRHLQITEDPDDADLTFYDWGMYVESLASVVPRAQQEN